MIRCHTPPRGWRCTRPAGHDGPCAVVPVQNAHVAFKSFTLGVLLAFLWVVTPFRLLGLSAEMFVVHPGSSHFSQSDDGYWAAIALGTRLRALGWTVTYAHGLQLNNEDVWGLTIPQFHSIVIDTDLHWSARAAVLAHEGGHALQPSWFGPVEGDCFADAVALLVIQDGIRDHARYLASAKWTCLGVLLAEFPSIYHAAALLTD